MGLHPGFAVGIVAHHMGEHIGVGIASRLGSVRSHLRLGQHLPVGAVDLAPDDPVGKGILSGIVGAVDHIGALEHIKIHQI